MNWGGIQICPYFNSQASKRIKCESVGMSDEQKTAIEFGTEKEKKNWIQKYCENQQYHLCPYAQIISKKYGIYHENKGFIEIGYELRVIQKNRVYKREGYKSFESYTKKKFGISRSTANKYIAVNKAFSAGGFSRKIFEGYQRYSFSQLAELAGIKKENRTDITPETTIKEIRALKRRIRDENIGKEAQKRTEESKNSSKRA